MYFRILCQLGSPNAEELCPKAGFQTLPSWRVPLRELSPTGCSQDPAVLRVLLCTGYHRRGYAVAIFITSFLLSSSLVPSYKEDNSHMYDVQDIVINIPLIGVKIPGTFWQFFQNWSTCKYDTVRGNLLLITLSSWNCYIFRVGLHEGMPSVKAL